MGHRLGLHADTEKRGTNKILHIKQRVLSSVSMSASTSTFGQVDADSLLPFTFTTNIMGVGEGALSSNATGTDNLAVGESALQSNITGADNTVFGKSALESDREGTQNLAVGANALKSIVAGDKNVALGDYCGDQVTRGNANLLVGSLSCVSMVDGEHNVSIGTASSANGIKISESTAVGTSALNVNANGTRNVCIGRFAGIALDSGPYSSSNANIALGAFALDSYNNNVNRLQADIENDNIVIGGLVGDDPISYYPVELVFVQGMGRRIELNQTSPPTSFNILKEGKRSLLRFGNFSFNGTVVEVDHPKIIFQFDSTIPTNLLTGLLNGVAAHNPIIPSTPAEFWVSGEHAVANAFHGQYLKLDKQVNDRDAWKLQGKEMYLYYVTPQNLMIFSPYSPFPPNAPRWHDELSRAPNAAFGFTNPLEIADWVFLAGNQQGWVASGIQLTLEAPAPAPAEFWVSGEHAVANAFDGKYLKLDEQVNDHDAWKLQGEEMYLYSSSYDSRFLNETVWVFSPQPPQDSTLASHTSGTDEDVNREYSVGNLFTPFAPNPLEITDWAWYQAKRGRHVPSGIQLTLEEDGAGSSAGSKDSFDGIWMFGESPRIAHNNEVFIPSSLNPYSPFSITIQEGITFLTQDNLLVSTLQSDTINDQGQRTLVWSEYANDEGEEYSYAWKSNTTLPPFQMSIPSSNAISIGYGDIHDNTTIIGGPSRIYTTKLRGDVKIDADRTLKVGDTELTENSLKALLRATANTTEQD